MPLPGEYMLNPGDIPRGGSAVRPTDEVGGDASIDPYAHQNGPEKLVQGEEYGGSGNHRLSPMVAGRTKRRVGYGGSVVKGSCENGICMRG